MFFFVEDGDDDDDDDDKTTQSAMSDARLSSLSVIHITSIRK